MNAQLDRLYNLLPLVLRQRDAAQGWPLRALLQVISEQVNLVEADIDQLYENWFIETCQDWVVPYIGDLVRYRPVQPRGAEADNISAQLTEVLSSRQEVANTIRYRRRKGTLALLEDLGKDTSGWSALKPVEFYKLLAVAPSMKFLQPHQTVSVDLCKRNLLARMNGPFDTLAHTVDVRSPASYHTTGFYNIPSVGLYIWRLRPYPVTRTTAYCLEETLPHCFTFSILSNDTPLYNNPVTSSKTAAITEENQLPIPITRHNFEEHTGKYYGYGKSINLWAPD
jgi:hypothetical protein